MPQGERLQINPTLILLLAIMVLWIARIWFWPVAGPEGPPTTANQLSESAAVIFFMGGWIALQAWILPRFGVAT